MKQKPVFKNATKGRIQVIQRGIPIWMNPGDVIVGERFRVFTKLGLVEVGKAGLPKPTVKPQMPQAVNDPEPEKAPVKVRKLQLTDVVIPTDKLVVSTVPMEVHSVLETTPVEEPVVEATSEPEPVIEEEAEELPDLLDSEETVMLEPGEEVVPLAITLTSRGDDLKEDIVADILKDIDDEPVVIMEEAEELKLEEPDDYPNKCDQCDRSFASKRGLKSHKRSHKS